jgi:23S rRNA (adenine2503-C2)-methyltransferase
MMQTSIYDANLQELEAFFERLGQPAYRASQLWEALYRQLVSSPEEITTLPKPLRQAISEQFSFSPLRVERTLSSRDGFTEKSLFLLADDKAIETVWMRYEHRNTLCISTQVGCAMGCAFCATGQMGFQRNLSAGEIIGQVLFYATKLHSLGAQLTNVVFMGMGEPFHNYDQTMAAIDRLNDPQGFAFGERRFTISTVGLVPKIRQFTAEKRQVNLAVSLHSVDDELRTRLIPMGKRYPVADILDACRDYCDSTHRRITFEWALIRDVNDSPAQARELAQRLRGMLCHVNLIPLNPTAGYGQGGSDAERARAFRNELERHGIPATLRIPRGIDIGAGCGQLATQRALETSML